ncbi:hypothetical protein GCM10020229_31260 [Kitasatospora albolonga]
MLATTAKGLPDRVPIVGRAVGQLIRVNLLDKRHPAGRPGLLSALPALFVVAVFAPASVRDGVVGSLRDQLGLQGEAQQQVRQLLSAGNDDVTQSFGVIGALVTLLSATALSRAMQRVCERCWDLPKSGVRLAAWRWLAWWRPSWPSWSSSRRSGGLRGRGLAGTAALPGAGHRPLVVDPAPAAGQPGALVPAAARGAALRGGLPRPGPGRQGLPAPGGDPERGRFGRTAWCSRP